MVNLRKIGAIATGALFIGATFGAALAQTVPATFSKSMLADGGMAKAQLIVGKDAPGKTADTASATVIKDAVAKKLTVAVGGKVQIKYGVKKWDDSEHDLNFTSATELTYQASDITTTNASVTGKILNVTKGTYGYLMIDGNADGDFKDTADYNIYSGVYVIDGTAGTVQFLYNHTTDRDTTHGLTAAGSGTGLAEAVTFKVKGKRYTVTEATSANEIKIGPTMRVTLANTTSDAIITNAVALDGTRKFSTVGGVLYFIDGTEVQQSLTLPTASGYSDNGFRITDATVTAGSFTGYKIYAKPYSGGVYVWAVDKNKEVSVVDTQADVLGYSKIYIQTSGTSTSFAVAGAGVYFVDAPLALKLDSTIDVPGTEYEITWETDKTMKLRRKKSTSVASGTKMKSTYADYDPFLDSDITASVADGKVKVAYGVSRWDDSASQLTNWTNATEGIGVDPILGTNIDGRIINVTKGTYGYLRIDGNADGDFKDTADYNIYSGLYVIDGSAGTLQFLYNFTTDRDTTHGLTAAGSGTGLAEAVTFKVKGKRYTLTEATSANEIKIGPTMRVTLANTTSDAIITNAVALDGTRKFSTVGGVLYFIDGTEVQQSLTLPTASGYSDNGFRITDATVTAGSFTGYKIYAKPYSGGVYVWAVDKNKEVSVVDTQADVLGYSKIYIQTSGTSTSFAVGGAGVYFVDAPLALKLDSTIDVSGTEYDIKWETDKKMKLRRKKSTSVASGTKLKSTYADYDPFLDSDITASIVEPETKAPSLDIKDETTADKTMNLVLLGGPVANKLTAELVTGKKSTKDWYTSTGDIEVVANAYTTGKSAIIVAGKNRDATKAAADALAAAL